jgi:ABC-type dipeptide/oligopeptide/nickel transport system permease subunit
VDGLDTSTIVPADISPGGAPAGARRAKRSRSFWDDAWYKFRHNWAGMAGLTVFVLLCLAAIFAKQIAPYDYLEQDWTAILQPPSAAHIMGTDDLGRDIFSRVLMGGRTALMVAMAISLTGAIVGLLVGAFSAFAGGKVDALVVWVIDGVMTFPAIWLAAFVSVATAPALKNLAGSLYNATGWEFLRNEVMISYAVVVFAIGMINWTWPARLVRSQVLSLREREFIEATLALGARPRWIIMKHLVPNVLGSMIVLVTLSFGNAMLFESSLSYLGIGIRPPGASWGAMIFQGMSKVRTHPYLVLAPGITLAVVVLALQFMGDALNDALNPKSRNK